VRWGIEARAPDALQHERSEVVQRRSGAVTISELWVVPVLQRTADALRCARDTRPQRTNLATAR